jgi:hypothetical protein
MEQATANMGYRILLMTGLLLALTMPACANAGTLLMWAGMAHFFVGNAIIGLCEAFFIARLYGIRYHLISPLAILANYLSMFAGLTLFNVKYSQVTNALLGDTPLYRLPWLVGVMAVIAFGLSILIEWPFYRLAFNQNRLRDIKEYGEEDPRHYRWQRTLQAVVFAHIASYLLLAVYYLSVSGTGFIRHARITHGLRFAANPTAIVYYLHDDKHYRIRLDGSPPVAVSAEEVDNIFTRYYERFDGIENYNSFSRFLTGFESSLDLRDHAGVGWHVQTDFWGTSGVRLENMDTGESFDLGLELPFVRWPSRHPTLLPGDQVVYQFGPQIVLLDISTRQLAFITRGSRPVVVCEQ